MTPGNHRAIVRAVACGLHRARRAHPGRNTAEPNPSPGYGITGGAKNLQQRECRAPAVSTAGIADCNRTASPHLSRSTIGIQMARQKLVRPRSGKVIAGVCAGVADYFNLNVRTVRIGFVLFGLVGAGELIYILLWIVTPEASQ